MKRIKTLAGDVYMADEVDEVIKRQAAAAIAGMNAATAISAGQVQQAHRLRAESSPEALESERQANSILTERIAELEKALRDIRVFLVEVNKGIEMGNIDSQIVADIDRVLMAR